MSFFNQKHFDWIFYVHFYQDLKVAQIANEEQALNHYQTHGKHEHRETDIDIAYYLKCDDLYGQMIYQYQQNNYRRSLSTIDQAFMTYLIRDLKLSPQSQVLEIGSDIAFLSLPLIKYVSNGHYYGLDEDQNSIDWATHHITSLLPHATFKCGKPFFPLPYPPESMDLIFTTTLFLKLPLSQLKPWLNQISRILKKNGSLVVTTFLTLNHLNQYLKPMGTDKVKVINHQNQFYLTNSHYERVILHDENLLKLLVSDQSQLVIDEIIFGHWNSTSNSDMYQDLIHLHK